MALQRFWWIFLEFCRFSYEKSTFLMDFHWKILRFRSDFVYFPSKIDDFQAILKNFHGKSLDFVHFHTKNRLFWWNFMKNPPISIIFLRIFGIGLAIAKSMLLRDWRGNPSTDSIFIDFVVKIDVFSGSATNSSDLTKWIDFIRKNGRFEISQIWSIFLPRRQDDVAVTLLVTVTSNCY